MLYSVYISYIINLCLLVLIIDSEHFLFYSLTNCMLSNFSAVKPEGKCSSLFPSQDVSANFKIDGALQQNSSADRRSVPRSDDGGQMDGLFPPPSENRDQMTDLWSNESLASNSSVGRTSMLELDRELELGAEDEAEDAMMESGSGEGLCDDIDLATSSSTLSGSLSQSWKIVRSASVSKPPNVLIYTGKIDSVRKFDKVRKVIEHRLDTDCYVIYHLKHEDLVSTPWIENTVLLVIATKKHYSDANDQFLKYFQSGGRILALGSGFDTTLVGRTQVRTENWINAFSYKSWTNVSLVSGFFVYNHGDVAIDNCHVTELAKDKDNNVVIVKCDQETKKSPGCAILSQVNDCFENFFCGV